ncbi:MAG: prepilin-type N-terminal cleavage/methylation domain-containing protein [Pseudomonadales bacterium]|nr:prepilin-type N-terminal cleavage/methylation domain-containing protein [Pseudomonadales bacterium]MCP5184486.1 prepilin-type N-terminal cleavage/methylation domain-containing protein [Pseudomonadales bacterium]
MSTTNHQHGYTLLELLVVAGIIALVAAIAVPMYQSHLNTAKASKLLHHYDEAVRSSRYALMQERLRDANATTSTLPATTPEWLEFLSGGIGAAPDGGAPYVASAFGDGATGAVGITFDDTNEAVTVSRPAYAGLPPLIAQVTSESVTYTTP